MDNNDKQAIFESRIYSEKTLEKQVVFISSSALAVTFIFSEKFIKLNICQCKSLIILSWIFFTLTLILNLVSQLTAVVAHDKLLEIYSGNKVKKKDKKYLDKLPEFWNKFTKCLQYISIITLLVGIILFVIFISINL